MEAPGLLESLTTEGRTVWTPSQVSELKSYLPLPVERLQNAFLEGSPDRNGHVSACAIAELVAEQLHSREVQGLPPPMCL